MGLRGVGQGPAPGHRCRAASSAWPTFLCGFSTPTHRRAKSLSTEDALVLTIATGLKKIVWQRAPLLGDDLELTSATGAIFVNFELSLQSNVSYREMEAYF